MEPGYPESHDLACFHRVWLYRSCLGVLGESGGEVIATTSMDLLPGLGGRRLTNQPEKGEEKCLIHTVCACANFKIN